MECISQEYAAAPLQDACHLLDQQQAHRDARQMKADDVHRKTGADIGVSIRGAASIRACFINRFGLSQALTLEVVGQLSFGYEKRQKLVTDHVSRAKAMSTAAFWSYPEGCHL